MNKLKVGVLQYNIEWEEPIKNLILINEYLKKYSKKIDILILPEMFLTGFTNNLNCALTQESEVFKKIIELSEKYQIAIAGSLLYKENNCYYNRFFYFHNGNIIGHYDKKHLFSYTNEHQYLTPGKETKVFLLNNYKIFPIICYDLRFPIWCRNKNYKYDILIVCANWPASRIVAWNKLLVARAIENQSYVIGANRIGFDGNKIYYNGYSSIIDFEGNVLNSSHDKEQLLLEELDLEKLNAFRKQFPFIYDDND
ncbi:MAG: nitrilase family protein [Bacteroidales bacterium]|nr:nitrilase family protein [Bacteroidales bacterium]